MITAFNGEFRWLSNFARVPIEIGGIVFRSVEHAYMSEKSDDEAWKTFCQRVDRPGDVKKASRKIKLSPDWEQRKVEVMRKCLEQKFNQEPFRSLLLATGNTKIMEGNHWGDTFWGVDRRTLTGNNMLGKLIMEIRTRLNENRR